jgi:hypothetical protein
VRQYTLDGHVVHRRESSTEDGWNKKESGHALSVQEIRNESAARYFWQSQPPNRPWDKFQVRVSSVDILMYECRLL